MARGHLVFASLFLICLGTGATSAQAQAWLPEKGALSFWSSYTRLDVDDHLFGIDVDEDNGAEFGEIVAQTYLLGGEYGITPWLAVDGTVAFIKSRYRGIFPESAIDDGTYNGDIQDLNLLVRFGAVKAPVAFTPYVGAVIPLSDYEILGHASVGRGLREYPIGFFVGRGFGPAYVQGQYQYSFVEDVGQYGLDRSNASAEFGYVIGRNWLVRAFGAWQVTHDGALWHEDVHEDDPESIHTHDQAAEAHWSKAGVGGSYRVTPDVVIFGAYAVTTHGENTHDGPAWSLGIGWDVR